MPSPPVPLDAIRLPAVVYRREGILCAANDRAEALAGGPLAGMTPADVIACLSVRHHDGTVLLPHELPAVRALRGEEVVDVPLTVRTADGRLVTLLASSAPIREGEGIAAALEVWQDVSSLERERARALSTVEEFAEQQEELRAIAEELTEEGRQRQLLDSILGTFPHRVSVWDRDQRLIWANARLVADCGQPLDELIGRSWREIAVGRNVDALLAGDALSAISAGGTVTPEIEVPGPGGTTWQAITDLPIFRDAHLLITEDVTGRRRAEEDLREDERRHAFLLALGDRLREAADVNEVTAVASGMLGSHLGVNGVVYCEIEPGAGHAVVRAGWTDGTMPVAAGSYRLDDLGIGSPCRQGLVVRTEDAGEAAGSARSGTSGVRAWLTLPIWRGGRLAAVISVQSARPRAWTDAEVELVRQAGDRVFASAERAQAEEALRASEERLRLAQESAGVAVWDWMLSTGVITYTPDFLRPFGVRAESIRDYDSWRRMVHPEDIGRIEAERNGAIERREPFASEFRVIVPSGEVRWMVGTGRGIRDADGRLVRVVGVNVDITERKEIEEERARFTEELQRSNEELQRFAYVASHDLQEPLRSIISFSQLLERRYKGQLGQDADDYIAFIVEGGNRMQRLIEDLLQYSRVQTKGRPLEPTETVEVVVGVLQLMETPIREAGATVTVGPLPRVMADPAQLAQVFSNLISNALKFQQPDVPAEVGISAVREGRFWRFAVRDNGIGIESEYHDRIFVIFQRLHTRAEYDGTGIGLAVVQRIVERHGGRIWVESVPGEGSTFFFTLPAA